MPVSRGSCCRSRIPGTCSAPTASATTRSPSGRSRRATLRAHAARRRPAEMDIRRSPSALEFEVAVYVRPTLPRTGSARLASIKDRQSG